jgi:hypothetical protein
VQEFLLIGWLVTFSMSPGLFPEMFDKVEVTIVKTILTVFSVMSLTRCKERCGCFLPIAHFLPGLPFNPEDGG